MYITIRINAYPSGKFEIFFQLNAVRDSIRLTVELL